jgi:hypothetical protein
MASTVHVENISTKTSEDEIKSFFSFCGKIQSLSVTPTGNDTQSASVTFEKAAAAKTALLLDNTQLGPNSVQVSAAKSIDELAGSKTETAEESRDNPHYVEQENKPRARIIAEYLAHGYVISDKAIESALNADKQHGISTKFMNFLSNVDQKTQATQRAQTMDSKLGVSDKAYMAFNSLSTYYDKAANTPTGQKLRAFYEQGNKTVMDVHKEARYLADVKKQESSVHNVPGSDKTQCSCEAQGGKCACPGGKCACEGCSKAAPTQAVDEKSGHTTAPVPSSSS